MKQTFYLIQKLLPGVLLATVLVMLSCGKTSPNRDFNPTEIDSSLSTVHDTVSICHLVDSLRHVALRLS